MNNIEEIPCKTASDFLDILRLSNRIWSNYASNHFRDWETYWIFRGQRRDWSLLPSAWRNKPEIKELLQQAFSGKFLSENIEGYFETIEHLIQEDRLTPLSQNELRKFGQLRKVPPERIASLLSMIMSERRIILKFIEFADSIGHQVEECPFIEPNAKNQHMFYCLMLLEHCVSDNYLNRMQEWFHSTVALSQHHGIPTRLLDWTTSPQIAAFYAADEAQKDSNIVVYALNTERIKDSDLELKRIRSNVSQYIDAQRGLFTLDTNAEEYYLKFGDWRDIETLVRAIPYNFGPYEKTVMRKIVLPASEANHVLRLLSLERVSNAYLQPTLDNAAKAVKNRLLNRL